MGKGTFTKRMDGCSQKFSTNTINGKKQAEGEVDRVKDNEFSGVK